MYDCPNILKNKRHIALDLETTGLSIDYNTIIELGVIEVQNGIVVQRYSRLFGGGYSPMFLVRNIHKIRDCERMGKKTFKECASNIASYLSNSIIVTHNGGNFDMPMLQKKLSECGEKIRNVKQVDTYQIARKIGHESNSLENLCKQYGIQYGGDNGNNSHRGEEDAEATLQLLYCFITEKEVSLTL